MAMDSNSLESQVAALKHELKLWESKFAAAHGGRKPSREDIKTEATIREKYRQYDQLRRRTSLPKMKPATPTRAKSVGDMSREQNVLAERSGNEVSLTPHRAVKNTTKLEVVEEEGQALEPTPSFIRCALGPTPQKDGQVLGIFDVSLSATPSRRAKSAPSGVEMQGVSATPSKSSAVVPALDPALLATPQSSSKRRFLDVFTRTPLKRKREDESRTPNSARRLFTTPAFLRRTCSLTTIDEERLASGPPFKKRANFVRSLSSIIQGLRQQEEERMDDEWDIMNEIEAEVQGEVSQKKSASPKPLDEDKRTVEMPLGPDQATEGSDDDIRVELNGEDRKPWKKKGLKRQTKRVKMRPVLHRPEKASELQDDEDRCDREVVSKSHTVTKFGDSASEPVVEDLEVSEYDGGKQEQQVGSSKSAGKQNEVEVVKPDRKVSKKISATAHPNYRALKIKNKNSKANGRGGRYRSRR
ncbi:hypothetical protein M433DRAFT_154690 [Acidomyces richmondensis BFW]|nr:MAG: hypothetical protein FE78DRAFT_90949 [Acidomyces sp. 'richmondensis']KYG45267.1 hypothetical protein M433DRAFT_154690 [Acidomyces richmondensis BFW]